jgi:CBS domain-containing protein
MNIESILDHKSEGAITIDIGQTVKAAADMMFRHCIAALVVTRDGAPVGIVSERDVVEALSTHGEHGGHRPLRQLITGPLLAVSPDETIKRAMSLMTHRRIRHLPVIESGELVGIVSLGDIVKYRLEELEMESNVLRDVYIAAR